MDEYLNLKDISKILKIRKDTIAKRFDKEDIFPIYLKGVRFYRSSDIEYIDRNVRNKYLIKNVGEIFTVIEYFLSHKENSSPDIAKICPLSTQKIDNILSDFLDNNCCVIAPSKMNVQ